jgi:hypothetical protein
LDMRMFPESIERPSCKRCGTRTTLVRIEPEGAGLENLIFTCPNCENVHTENVVADPMEACKGWLSSELKPPV